MIEYGELTPEEVIAIGWASKWQCAYAHEDGVLVSIYLHTDQHRTESCDNCTLTCHIGSTPFTREDRRKEGIFNGLYEWVKQQHGYGLVVYNSGDYPPDFLSVASQFNIELGVLSGELKPEGYQERLPLVIGTFNRIAEIKGLAGI